MAKRDYYEILGIARSATPDEIKKAHRKLARKLHPDVNREDAQAGEKFAEVQEAYDVLSDPQKRQQYDQFGHAGVGAAGGVPPGGGDPFEAFRRAGGRSGAGRADWRGGPNVTVQDFDMGGGAGGAGFSDLFDQLFGGRGGPAGVNMPGGGGRNGGTRAARGRPEYHERGLDVEHPVTLLFEQAARGTTLPLQISRGGKLETIDVKIPPGVKDGSRIRIKGRGQETAGGTGDLYIVTTVKPHAYFRRDGLDVYLDAPVSLYEALLGTRVEVPTLDGPVTLTVPPGTSSGAKLRIRDRGIARGEEKGDQLVVLKIVVPKQLDEESRAAVDAMSKRQPVNARADVPWA